MVLGVWFLMNEVPLCMTARGGLVLDFMVKLLPRNRTSPGPYSLPMPRVLWRSWGGGRFRKSEVPL